jgi:hypothetical protein
MHGDAVFKSGHKSLSIRTDHTVRTNCKAVHNDDSVVGFELKYVHLNYCFSLICWD